MTAIYPLYKQAALRGEANCDLDTNTVADGVYCVLLSGGYTYSAAHQFYTALTGIIGGAQRITVPTVSANGTFDGGDLTFPSVPGATVVALGLYRRNSGASSTWRLVYYYDTVGGGLPAVTTGGNVTVQWNSAGIFTI